MQDCTEEYENRLQTEIKGGVQNGGEACTVAVPAVREPAKKIGQALI